MERRKGPSRRLEPDRCIPCWDALDARTRAAIAACPRKAYADRERLCLAPAERTGFLLVLEGRLRIYLCSTGGKEFTLYHTEAGACCTLMPMEGRGTPIIESIGESVVIHLGVDLLLKMVHTAPEAFHFLLQTMGQNTQAALGNIERTCFGTMRSSIAGVILEHLPPDGDTAILTHEQIANHIGTTREVVSRELELLRDRGVIATGRGRIRILDRGGLRAIAENNMADNAARRCKK